MTPELPILGYAPVEQQVRWMLLVNEALWGLFLWAQYMEVS